MFKKKNPVRKLEVKSEDTAPRKIEIKIMPLVTIEQQQLTVNGKPKAPEYRISIENRDVITLSQRQYDEMFLEMLRHKDARELIHDISAVHAEEHVMQEQSGRDIKSFFSTLDKAVEEAMNG